MKQVSGNEVREATAELEATTGTVPQPSSPARSCKGDAGRDEVTCGMGVSLRVRACTEAGRTTRRELAGKESAMRLRQQDAGDAARASERDETERDLVRRSEEHTSELQ